MYYGFVPCSVLALSWLCLGSVLVNGLMDPALRIHQSLFGSPLLLFFSVVVVAVVPPSSPSSHWLGWLGWLGFRLSPILDHKYLFNLGVFLRSEGIVRTALTRPSF